ncbi:Probable ion channel POLLUX [Striga hermonthica]|uniref:Probable ion channel POLLUX n=1 Tax=Striga hermonthica TaxID=68872 RepID=A0A9N7NZ22_STRHE|nr:Probable ion channel POLLUX [Striga hermonthica]
MKSKTTPSGSDDPRPLHFPAVRRLSPSHSFHYTSSLSSSDATSSSDGGYSSSSSDALSFNLSDRGLYSTRRSVSFKSPYSVSSSFSKSHKQPPSLSAARSTSTPANLSRDTVDSSRGLGSPINKPKLRHENDLKALSLQASSGLVPATSVVSAPNDSTNSCSVLRISSFRYSWMLSFFCFISLSYAMFLRIEVARLQEESTNLRTFCSHENVVDSKGIGSLELENDSSALYFGNTDSRAIALYTVIVTLLTPFVLYKYLNYLPRVITLLKREKDGKEEVPLKNRIAYMVDVCFSVYPYAKLLALLFATLFVIGFGGVALYGVSDSSLAEALWLSWTFVADSGSHADRVGIGPRIVSVSISSGGMLIFAMMLGLVSDAISEKVDSLRKGKSEVIESNHILILGWSDKLGSLLKQLAIANKSIGGGVIVVLAERDKEEMEMDIAQLEFNLMGTSVICRSGSPLILADLKKVSVSKARAIIVLASDENADQSDARALRVVLSLTGVKESLRGHVVVEMSDLDNEPLVKLVGGELIETVVAHDVIGRLMIQCALQPGLAQIWEDILGFENAEFYIKRWPELDGRCFEDVLISFPDAIPCGVKISAEGGKIRINPDDDYVIREGDEILVIAEDDDTYAPASLPKIWKGLTPRITNPPKFPEKILFCGWRRDIQDMIMVLEAFLAPGSELWMFNEVPEKDREKKLTDGGLDISGLVNLKLVHREGNAVIRRHLESLPLETFDSILILADESVEDSIVHSDSRSLATLLLIRDIQSKRLPCRDAKSPSLRHSGFSQSSWIREMQQASDKSIIISEILDSRTRNLVSVTRISDYVLSNELVSMALAMVAEDKQINRVLEELFAEKGNEMCIKPGEFYLYDQEEISFFEIMVRGRQREEIVIGYRLATDERAVINPVSKLTPRKWSIDDVFVVISKGE